METAAVLTPDVSVPTGGTPAPHGEYRCECGRTFRVSGGGRHRIYFEPSDSALDDPVMNGVCPECGRGLPGKQ